MSEKETVKDVKISPIGIEGGPSQEEIDGWKETYGDVYVAKFSDTEKYIYRPMKRVEYKQIVNINQSPDSRTFAEEKVAQMCVVWPKIDATKLATFKAGTISTLVDLIMAASNFGIAEEPQKL
jgi:hypothetical protein